VSGPEGDPGRSLTPQETGSRERISLFFSDLRRNEANLRTGRNGFALFFVNYLTVRQS
jgi:hypothetical protein